MFPQKISQNVDILAGIHENVFPWQPTPIVNKASFWVAAPKGPMTYAFTYAEFSPSSVQ